MFAKPTALIALTLVCASASFAQQASAPDSPSNAASKPDAATNRMNGDKAMKSTNKASKPPTEEAASQPTAKKPAKKGAQSGPAASQ